MVHNSCIYFVTWHGVRSQQLLLRSPRRWLLSFALSGESCSCILCKQRVISSVSWNSQSSGQPVRIAAAGAVLVALLLLPLVLGVSALPCGFRCRRLLVLLLMSLVVPLLPLLLGVSALPCVPPSPVGFRRLRLLALLLVSLLLLLSAAAAAAAAATSSWGLAAAVERSSAASMMGK
jgi:hypothetical protein